VDIREFVQRPVQKSKTSNVLSQQIT